MKNYFTNHFYMSFLFLIVLNILLFYSLDYLVRINLDNFSTIALKNSSKDDLENLHSTIANLKIELEELKLKSHKAVSISFPTLNDIKQTSKKYALLIGNVQKVKENEKNSILYNISLQGSIYNIINFLKSFEERYIFDIELLSLHPLDITGNSLELQLSINLKP